MTDDKLIAALRGLFNTPVEKVDANTLAIIARKAADRLSELSPSRLSANDEGVVDEELIADLRKYGNSGNKYIQSYWARSAVLKAADLLEAIPQISDEECDHICMGECATEGCENCGLHYYESGGVGSYYCGACLRKIKALATKEPPDPSRGWLIHKAGRGWYRPNAQGYTNKTSEAGRYSRDEAESYSHPNGWDGPRDGITIKHESEVTPTPASGEQMEVVAWLLKTLTDKGEPLTSSLRFYDPHSPDAQPLVTLEAAQKAVAERDGEIERLRHDLARSMNAHSEAEAEIERMTPKFVAYEYLESPAGREIAEARVAELEAALRDIEDETVLDDNGEETLSDAAQIARALRKAGEV
ncbi:hypothetical protein [Pelagibacterium luteolum]|uniref:Uncharacterized protein n=1 Tax=Pelagibacterium luteolum TaxID=440168 RepID=A0A1G7TJX7_9HYPH|nr:hypothetical protein [Pelagibacterium luteolum]SDG35618.1 hypothetical protein SAMN04487974_102177 [Pelagibacterium luteolum]